MELGSGVPFNVASSTGQGNYDGTSFVHTGVGGNTTSTIDTSALPEGWATNPLGGQTGATLPVDDQIVYSSAWLKNTMPNLVFDMFAERPHSFAQGEGEIVKFKRLLDLPCDDPNSYILSDGLTPEGLRLDVTFVSAKVEYYGAYITYTDRAMFHDPLGVVKECRSSLATLGSRVANNVTRNALFSTANWFHFGGAQSLLEIAGTGTIAGDIAQIETDLKEIITFFEARNVDKISDKISASTNVSTEPIDSAYIVFVNPQFRFTIEKLTDFVPVRKYASNGNTIKNEIGTYKNLKFIADTNVPAYHQASTLVDINAVSAYWTGTANVQFQDSDTGTAESGTTDFAKAIFPMLICGKGGYGVVPVQSGNPEIIVKEPGSSGVTDALNQRGSVGFKFGKTAVILDAQRVVCYNAILPSA